MGMLIKEEVLSKVLVKGNCSESDVVINVYDRNEKVGSTVSDINGDWQLELEPKVYIFSFTKVNRIPLRLVVLIPCDKEISFFQKVVLEKVNYVSEAQGSILYQDVVLDENNSPVSNVQIQFFIENQKEVVAEAVTDLEGKFSVFLKPAKYDMVLYKFGCNNNRPKVIKLNLLKDRRHK